MAGGNGAVELIDLTDAVEVSRENGRDSLQSLLQDEEPQPATAALAGEASAQEEDARRR